jgi:hypothetical protein
MANRKSEFTAEEIRQEATRLLLANAIWEKEGNFLKLALESQHTPVRLADLRDVMREVIISKVATPVKPEVRGLTLHVQVKEPVLKQVRQELLRDSGELAIAAVETKEKKSKPKKGGGGRWATRLGKEEDQERFGGFNPD